jgi:hypothetical protein
MMPTNDDLLAALAAKQEIRDALSRYCRAMDRRDEPLAAALWHSGGTADYGAEIFTGSGSGFATWVTEIHTGFQRTSHQITNVLCEVVGDRAVSEAYVTVALWGLPDESGAVIQTTSRGRYLDRWSQRDGRWAVDARQFLEDFSSYQSLPAAELGHGNPLVSRDHDDPSYALLSSLT